MLQSLMPKPNVIEGLRHLLNKHHFKLLLRTCDPPKRGGLWVAAICHKALIDESYT